ncbi:MAG: translation elongation factor 4 [Candidatus Parcubacteria bacterium]|nr:translation elongation factor 4 [Candidatus Parcubacteria bacterium]
MNQNNIRNYCIIAHIDHGKSTLADRFLELTGTVEKRNMKAQILDSMDLERERGITIKLTPVQMKYQDYTLNLIDTPGHVDFTYEVSRSLACVEGAILLVDATQGIQAQTIANLYLAIEQNLTIIPVINKIDLPNAQVTKTKIEIINLLGCKEDEILMCSAKTGEGVKEILDAVIKRVPATLTNTQEPFRALIFDSFYDEYKGVIVYVRVFDGELKKGQPVFFIASETTTETLEVGKMKISLDPTEILAAGQIGYIVTGLKDVEKSRVGDTITLKGAEVEPLPGYKEVRPMVFAGIFCKEGSEFNRLREAVNKLKLNDAALFFEPEHSSALGFGFRCGFLGLLHLEIFQERLKREFNLDLIVTVPSVGYKVTLKSAGLKKELAAQLKSRDFLAENLEANQIVIKSPVDLPDPNYIEKIEEPLIKVDIVSPKDFMGGIMQLVAEKRGEYINTEYLMSVAEVDQRVILHYKMPLASILTDFYDKLKSLSSGYASLNYEFCGYQKAEVERLDILVAEEIVESLATIVYKDEAFKVGKKIVSTLKESLPKQWFVVKLQAAVGGKILASERLSAYRKDVIAKLYGGDVTRKNKLLDKQKKGKKKMAAIGAGSVDIPTETFLKILKR